MRKIALLATALMALVQLPSQTKPGKKKETQAIQTATVTSQIDSNFKTIKWRNIGPLDL